VVATGLLIAANDQHLLGLERLCGETGTVLGPGLLPLRTCRGFFVHFDIGYHLLSRAVARAVSGLLGIKGWEPMATGGQSR